MTGHKRRREYTDKQKRAAAISHKRKLHTDEVRTIRLEGSLTEGKVFDLVTELNKYLINYNAGLIEIARKHPFGDPDRPSWLEAHRKNGVKHIKEIVQAKENVYIHK